MYSILMKRIRPKAGNLQLFSEMQKNKPANLTICLFLNVPPFWLPKTYMPSECHPSKLFVCLPASSLDV